MKKTTQRFFLVMMQLALGAMLLSSLLYGFRNKEIDFKDQVNRFQQQFVRKDMQAAKAVQDFAEIYQQAMDAGKQEHEIIEILTEKYGKKGLSFFLLSHDTLLLWTNNNIPIDENLFDNHDFSIQKLRNGWYFSRQMQEENLRYMVFSLIKSSYRYQNKFLQNQFQSDYNIQGNFYFITDREEEGFAIFNHEDQYAFSLNLRRTTGLYETRPFMAGLVVFLGIAGLVVFVFSAFRYFSVMFQRKNKTLAILGFILLMGLFRFLTFIALFPRAIYHEKLFSPALYATSAFLPSLGDLFLNVLFFSVISFFLFAHLKQFDVQMKIHPTLRIFFSLGIFILIYLYCIATVFLIRSLVIDSNLNLDVNFIFSLDIYSLVGFLIIGCIFFAYFFFSVFLFRVAMKLLRSPSLLWTVFLVSLGVFILLQWLLVGPHPLQWFLYFATMLVFEMERRSGSPQAGFTSLMVSLFLFSLISSIAINTFKNEKELERTKSMALQLASEQDPVAEFLFMEMEADLFIDHQLRNLVINDPYNEGAINRYLLHHYFYDFWVKYDLQTTVCRPGDRIQILPSYQVMQCMQYFEDYIDRFGKFTISDKLIYLDNNTGRNSYICIIPVKTGDLEEDPAEYFIYLELDSKYVSRDLGFPELLIDDRIDINRNIGNYSYATYRDGLLISKSGAYNYSMYASTYSDTDEVFFSFFFDGYNHLLYQKDESIQIIISRPVETFLEKIAPFSYLFILFFVLIVIFYMMTAKQSRSAIFRLNFKRRVRASMITMVIVSVLAIGGASALFIMNVSDNKNLAFLREKAHSILIDTEITLDMADIQQFDDRNLAYLTDMLLRQSNIFFTDINLYDIDGSLLSSSRWKVFEEGLAGTLMNPIAFFSLRNHRLNQFIHTENIGKLEYLSAYILLRNPYQELLGYINLPYFAKQGELRAEMTYFLVAFINIYLLLLVIAIIVALFISNFVTRPLQLIREHLSRVQLGRTNQKIDWTRNDEIGSLVVEYNRMIDELSESAHLLARSERESAWREMAKQVAHEIKNPLTPMRLNIQYLEKAWNEKVPDWEDRLSRFSKTMIEQIDNLALIAGAFSDFAKMPAGNNNKLDFRLFLPEALGLFNDADNVVINLSMPPGIHPLMVRADRSQLIRVINNLINNAIQSYPKHQTAQVDVICTQQEKHLYVGIKDYGCGIPESLKDNIFSPNFTTKTSGMGLGLSMVKAIIENLGGQVDFSSEEDQGSVFSFLIPLAELP